uniref:Uncharacterized protein n=1 Tax=Glossina austeni TaxID=7395 RepID=A0A1A9VSD3_GLOAU
MSAFACSSNQNIVCTQIWPWRLNRGFVPEYTRIKLEDEYMINTDLLQLRSKIDIIIHEQELYWNFFFRQLAIRAANGWRTLSTSSSSGTIIYCNSRQADGRTTPAKSAVDGVLRSEKVELAFFKVIGVRLVMLLVPITLLALFGTTRDLLAILRAEDNFSFLRRFCSHCVSQRSSSLFVNSSRKRADTENLSNM